MPSCLSALASRSARLVYTSARSTFPRPPFLKPPSLGLIVPSPTISRPAPCRRCLSSLARPRPRLQPHLLLPFPAQQRRGKAKTVEELRSRYTGAGPFSVLGLAVFVATAAALWWYFDQEKERVRRRRIADASKGVGRPRVGGPFSLVDQDGRPFTSEDLKGRYSLVYFGFTHCPDICPEELDKMARIVDLVQAGPRPAGAAPSPGPTLVPVFITCDPARDTPAVLKSYLAEFHPGLVGLTGSYPDIKAVCKAYRVYFSTPENVPAGRDYLVDHSIYFYLMDPDGDFVEALGRQHSPDEGAKLILSHMADWPAARAV